MFWFTLKAEFPFWTPEHLPLESSSPVFSPDCTRRPPEEPGTVSAKAGEITFAVENRGGLDHNFTVEDASPRAVGEIDSLAPRRSGQLTLALRPGTYTYFCAFPGHREPGMPGTARVSD